MSPSRARIRPATAKAKAKARDKTKRREDRGIVPSQVQPWEAITRIAPRALPGVFVDRPHRFAAHCRLASGELIEAHLPNPGRMTGTAAPGRPVLLDGPYPPGKRSLRYTLLAIREPSAWVGCVTQLANETLPQLLRAGLLPELGQPKHMLREVRHGRSRFDWQLFPGLGSALEPPLWLECKSATLGRGRSVAFPDAVTARGTKHLRELSEMQRSGERCAVLFVAQRADARRFEVASDIDPKFSEALRDARRAGVAVYAASIQLGPRGYRAHRRLYLDL